MGDNTALGVSQREGAEIRTESPKRPPRERAGRRRLRFSCETCGAPTDAVAGTSRDALRVCRECFGRGPDKRPRELNDLEGREWAQASRSVEQYPDTRSSKQKLHG